MTEPLRTIGVLGGMGPEATILFMQRMLGAVAAFGDADHIPMLVDHNTQVPSRIQAIVELTGRDPAPVLADMARRLEGSGARALAMPCNTAHHFAGAIGSAVSIPLINMVEVATAKARQQAGVGARVGILGSPALRLAKVLEPAFRDHGLTPVYFDDEARLLSLIKDIKKHASSGRTAAELSDIAGRLTASGADLIMICCTEFSLMAPEVTSAAPVLDTLDELVSACCAYSAGMGPILRAANTDQPVHGSDTGFSINFTDHQGKEMAQC